VTDFADDGKKCCRRYPGRVGRVAHGNERLGQERVPCQNGDRLPKDLVVGRIPAPEVIVIHGRQVIMNQGIGMNHLHGAGRRHGMAQITSDGLACREHENRPDPLASGKNGIAH
jgi:hypothetical protein